MNAKSTSSFTERLGFRTSFLQEHKAECELAMNQSSRTDHRVSKCRGEGTQPSNVGSTYLKYSSNNRPCRSFRRILPIASSKTRKSKRSLSILYGGGKNNSQHLKNRKRVKTSTTTVAAATSESVVSDDDISVSPIARNSNNDTKRKAMKVATTKKSNTVSPPLEPLPLKLKKSQIHSKKHPFPHKLFDLLKKASVDDRSSEVVSWSSDGTTFVVHDHALFAAEFLPTYFGHTQFRSFDRQLNYWGFELISPKTINNKSFGGKSWQHPFFQKGRRDLLKQVTRKTVVRESSSSKKNKSLSVAHVANKKTSRTVLEIDETFAATTPMIEKYVKNVSWAQDFASRTVSPVHSVPSDESSDSPALDVVEWDENNYEGNLSKKGHTSVSTDIEDAFLLLFPLDLFEDESKQELEVEKIESVQAKDFASIPPQEFFRDVIPTLRSNKDDVKLVSKDNVVKGNEFHDIGSTTENVGLIMEIDTDMDIEMPIEEAELFLNIIQDTKGIDSDDCSLSLQSDSKNIVGNAGDTVDDYVTESSTWA